MDAVRTVSAALLAVFALSCGTTAPVRISAGDQCYGCRRSIYNARLGSEIITGERSRVVSKFRGPACMARYLIDHPGEHGAIYVTDYSSGKMTRPDRAYFVAETVDRDTGETEYRTYKDEDEARAAAAELQAGVLSWNEVLARAHGPR